LTIAVSQSSGGIGVDRTIGCLEAGWAAWSRKHNRANKLFSYATAPLRPFTGRTSFPTADKAAIYGKSLSSPGSAAQPVL
jgi:hypothetical protein